MMYIIYLVLLMRIGYINTLSRGKKVGWNGAISNETATIYNNGVYTGIINSTKYTLESFAQDQPIFRNMYKDYISLMVNGNEMIDYQNWLIMNNYGLLEDTSESMLKKKTNALRKRDRISNKERFMRTVKTGDILISTRNYGDMIGHAAIMVSDYWVLEMRGGRKGQKVVRNNNRQISKSDWFNDYGYEWTTVYRCPDSSVAKEAAYWADRNYFNPYGGQEKTICVTYEITPDFASTDPSYSSKLVLQAYYYGAPGVISDVTKYGSVIVPSRIPSYFLRPYKLVKIGKF